MTFRLWRCFSSEEILDMISGDIPTLHLLEALSEFYKFSFWSSWGWRCWSWSVEHPLVRLERIALRPTCGAKQKYKWENIFSTNLLGSVRNDWWYETRVSQMVATRALEAINQPCPLLPGLGISILDSVFSFALLQCRIIPFLLLGIISFLNCHSPVEYFYSIEQRLWGGSWWPSLSLGCTFI